LRVYCRRDFCYGVGGKLPLIMEKVLSFDGTAIACERSGSGPPLVLVHGGVADHTRWRTVLDALGTHFTVFAMTRLRGRMAPSRAIENFWILHKSDWTKGTSPSSTLHSSRNTRLEKLTMAQCPRTDPQDIALPTLALQTI
jgi:hypothetical protein